MEFEAFKTRGKNTSNQLAKLKSMYNCTIFTQFT